MKTGLFLLLVLVLSATVSCQSPRSRKAQAPAVSSPQIAEKRWKASISRHSGYEMTYKVVCQCDVIPVVTVNVDKTGKVLAVKAQPADAAPEVSDAMTIERLFKIIERTKKGRELASELETKFNGATGAPESIFIDPDPSATDDEERIVIMKLKFNS